MNKKKSNLLIALFITIIIILAAWFFLLKPIDSEKKASICDFKSGESINIDQLANCRFKDGDTVNLKGIVSGIGSWNSNYGSYNYYALKGDIFNPDDNSPFFYILDDKQYGYGDEFEKTLHIREIDWNGVKMFSADEFCFHLMLASSIKKAIERTSYMGGIGLKQESLDENGAIKYIIYTKNADGYPLEWLNIFLLKGKNVEYDLTNVNDTLLNSNSGLMYTSSQDVPQRTYSKQFAGIIPFMTNKYIYTSGLLGPIFKENINDLEYFEIVDYIENLQDSPSQNDLIE